MAKHCAIIASRNNPDYRVSKKTFYLELATGFSGIETKPKSVEIFILRGMR